MHAMLTTMTRTQANEGSDGGVEKEIINANGASGNQYRNGAKVEDLMMTSRRLSKYLPQRVF
jgi:hypothetical protein